MLCVMGLPASGKTTLCQLLCATGKLHIRSHDGNDLIPNIERISFDDLEESEKAFHACEFEPSAWRKARERAFERVDTMRRQKAHYHQAPVILLLDDNFYYKSMRKRFKPHGVIFLNRAVNDCISLNRVRHKPLPESIIESMAVLLEIPEPSQNLAVLTVTPTVDETPEEILEYVIESRGFWSDVFSNATCSTPYAQETPGLTDREKALDELEKQLRRCVSNLAIRAHFPPAKMKRISSIKQAIMGRCKAGVTPDSTSDEIEDIIEEAVVQFNAEVSKL